MTKTKLISFTILLTIILISIGFAPSASNLPDADTNPEPPSTQDNIQQSESIEAFNTMMQVLTHKRCVNCHPADDYPRQGEDSHIHLFGVRRGSDNHGVAAVKCETCHQKENNDFSGVPGAPEWSLAPKRMAWQGLTRVEIAKSMMDPKRNNGRNLKETVKHLTEHELVLWAFEPGVNHEGIPREKPPVSREDYIAAVKKWAETGAVIPEE